MKLFEFEAKEIFKENSIPIPSGSHLKEIDEVMKVVQQIDKPVVVKVQVLAGKRGKAGGIQFVEKLDEVRDVAQKLLGMEIHGYKVENLLIEEKLSIAKEIYVGSTIDRSQKRPVIIVSKEGGMDIEELAETAPEKIVKHYIDPIKGLRAFETRAIAKRAGFQGKIVQGIAGIISKLYKIMQKYDAELTEINPLVLTTDGKLIAADARLNIDDASVYRHSNIAEKHISRIGEIDEKEKGAKEAGMAYVELDGDIGIIGNGAGLVMATLDMVALYGGKAANFCDLGGGARADVVEKAIDVVLMNPRVKCLFLNILGGITRCDEVAKGLVKTRDEKGIKVPIIVRMVGTNEEEGRKIAEKAGIKVLDTMAAGAQAAVKSLE
ncbi:MAG: ADP-forming succinate--CoA ligase subunit beta [Promethearchaeota archaeon]